MIKHRWLYWVIGTLTAFAGVYVVKILAPQIAEDNKIVTMLAGYTMCIFGLFIITLGTRRKEPE